jgi:hypothetical protein
MILRIEESSMRSSPSFATGWIAAGGADTGAGLNCFGKFRGGDRGLRWLVRCAAGGGGGFLDILLHDASRRAGAGDAGKIDAEFTGDLAGERGGFHTTAFGGGWGGSGGSGGSSLLFWRGSCGFRRFCGGGRGIGASAIAIQHGEDTANRRFIALIDQNFRDYALVEGLHLHRGLVGFHFR